MAERTNQADGPNTSTFADPMQAIPDSARWRRFGVTDRDASRAVRELWSTLQDPRTVVSSVDVSANVSTNRVFLLRLSDDTHLFAKVSNYGSAFLFREDHDRVLRLRKGLAGTRFEKFLAAPLTRTSSPTPSSKQSAATQTEREHVHTYYDGSVWGVIYQEVERRESLPKILNDADIECLAREVAAFHKACSDVTIRDAIPRTSTSISSDMVHLLDLVADRTASKTLRLPAEALDIVRRHGQRFLHALDDLGYADMPRIPVLVDWNLGNFSVDRASDGSFQLFSRWDYDWFRTDTLLLDFYFLSRVSSQTGDRTRFSYGVHTLSEPRFTRFIAAYNEVSPLSEADIEMMVETYRFFILHYVLSVGDHFFRTDLWNTFRQDAIVSGLPSVDAFDRAPLLAAIRS
jgi:hypothetical protein